MQCLGSERSNLSGKKQRVQILRSERGTKKTESSLHENVFKAEASPILCVKNLFGLLFG